MLTQSNLVNNVIQSLSVINANKFTGGNTQEVGMGLLPFFHIMAFNALALCTFRVGGRVLCLPRFEPETFIDCLKQNKVCSSDTINISIHSFPKWISDNVTNFFGPALQKCLLLNAFLLYSSP